jgi:hypothetical protein
MSAVRVLYCDAGLRRLRARVDRMYVRPTAAALRDRASDVGVAPE